ncbi:PRD domain-containing protein [Enterococcus casseliflavus]|uniref:helix-turn-helix domain-containing protein n=1 Tax=Enterococcus casseliflavus TaxID=37734 RepID=UPI0008E83984|nr:helix-turn-helix domain-containing protein [Enterococcus casseliflavus]SFE57309.1 PRD domain-containing protein [Enterococcus casseliflavus]
MDKFQFQFIMNKQTVRFIKIISTFLHNSPVTLKHLSESTNSSIRTITTDIDQLKKHFGDSIQVTPSRSGYSLKIKDKSEFMRIRKELVRKEPLFEIIESIFYSEMFSQRTWADKLYIDEVTLKRYLSKIKATLKDYSIEILEHAGKLDFFGEEINIRKFFHDFYYSSDITPHTVFPSISVQELTKDIKSATSTDDEYSFGSFHSFSYTLFIAMERIKKGKIITTTISRNLDKIKQVCNYDSELMDLFSQKLNIELAKEEVTYLYIMFVTSRSIFGTQESDQKFINKFTVFQDATEKLSNCYLSLTRFPLKDSPEILELYQTFFTIIFLKNSVSPVLNYNLQEIVDYAKKEYPVLFLKVYSFVRDNLGDYILLNDRMLTSISSSLVFFTDSIVGYYWKPCKNIACIIEGPPTLVDNIRLHIYNLFERKNNLFFPDATDISNEYWKDNNIEIIITNYDEIPFEVNSNLKIYTMEYIPTKMDWIELQRDIMPKVPEFFPTDLDGSQE